MMRGPGGPRGMKHAGKPGAKNPKKTLMRILREVMSQYKYHYLAVLVCIVVSAFASVRGTLFTQTLIDDYILPMIGQNQPDFGPLGRAIAGVACLYAIGAFASWLQNYLMIFVTQGALKNLRMRVFEKMQYLPIKYFDTHAHGSIMSVYTNDIDTMRQMISQSLTQLITSLVTIASVLISMIVLSVPLTLITLVMVALMLFISMGRMAKSGGFSARQQQNLGKVNGYIEEMMDGQKVIKVFCHEDEIIEKLFNLADEIKKPNVSIFVEIDPQNLS